MDEFSKGTHSLHSINTAIVNAMQSKYKVGSANKRNETDEDRLRLQIEKYQRPLGGTYKNTNTGELPGLWKKEKYESTKEKQNFGM